MTEEMKKGKAVPQIMKEKRHLFCYTPNIMNFFMINVFSCSEFSSLLQAEIPFLYLYTQNRTTQHSTAQKKRNTRPEETVSESTPFGH
jgi:hypothetical protein